MEMEMIIKYTVTTIILIFTTKQKILKRLKKWKW